MPRLPRPRPGEPIKAEHYHALADACERNEISVGSSGGLCMHQGPSGSNLWVELPQAGLRIAVLSGSLANATSATAPTSQTATLYAFDGTTLATTGVSVTVWNFHDKTFASGAFVVISQIDSYWFVVDVRSCTNVS